MSNEDIIKSVLDKTREMNKLIQKLSEFQKLENNIRELKYISEFKDELLEVLNIENDYKNMWLNEIQKINDDMISLTFYHIEALKGGDLHRCDSLNKSCDNCINKYLIDVQYPCLICVDCNKWECE